MTIAVVRVQVPPRVQKAKTMSWLFLIKAGNIFIEIKNL